MGIDPKKLTERDVIADILEKPVDPFEMKTLIRRLGKPIVDGEGRKSRIPRVARLLGISERKCRSYWDEECEHPHPGHFAKVKRLLGEPIVQEASHELDKLRERIARLETALAVQDENYTEPFRHALRQSVGRSDRSMD